MGADDLLFSVMKELTFSYLESPAGLSQHGTQCGGERQSQNLVPRFAVLSEIEKTSAFFFLSLYAFVKFSHPQIGKGAIANMCTDLLCLAGEKAPC